MQPAGELNSKKILLPRSNLASFEHESEFEVMKPAKQAVKHSTQPRSGGPKTIAGKRRSSMNSLKHGLTAQTPALKHENPEEFELLRWNLVSEWQPQSQSECELVGARMAAQLWRLRRALPFETAIIQARCADIEPWHVESNEEFRARKMGEIAARYEGKHGSPVQPP
jgi:hypothetical protein